MALAGLTWPSPGDFFRWSQSIGLVADRRDYPALDVKITGLLQNFAIWKVPLQKANQASKRLKVPLSSLEGAAIGIDFTNLELVFSGLQSVAI